MKSTHFLKSVYNNCATTNITSSAYLQIDGSGLILESGKIIYYNSTGATVKLALGTIGAEQDWMRLYPTVEPKEVEMLFPKNTRLSIKSIEVSPIIFGIIGIDFYV